MKMKILYFVFFIVCISISNCVLAESYSDRVDVKNFIKNFSIQHKVPEASLITLFENVKRQDQVLEAIQRPAEKKKNWQQYRKIFITDKRVSQGIQFWSENAQILAAAERHYGVPPEIIVAIIGVETFYGKYKGKYPVLDSLVTLGFDYPPRQNFFRSELEQFLLLTYEENLDPQAIKGSYAGAMGKSQFISSSYRHYAIDFDEDGRRDLWDSNEDAIGSVANYFKMHGWISNAPVAVSVVVHGDSYKELVAKGMKPSTQFVSLSEFGVEVEDESNFIEKVALLEFVNDRANEYWAGFNNFYVITRYNHSHMYAMAVYQLSQKIKQDIKDYVVQN